MQNNPTMDFSLLAAYHEVPVVQETVTPTSMSQQYEISESGSSKMNAISIKGKTRKRSQTCFKSSEEMEIERKIHIEVERNRRKQMNEHLQTLRQLMPSSYVQRGDQASIIGGTIEFVKDLEKHFKFLESQKRCKISCGHHELSSTVQVINKSKKKTLINTHLCNNNIIVDMDQQDCLRLEKEMKEKRSIMVNTISSLMDVQVKLIGPDEAVIKIMSQKRPSQLLKIIVALQEDLHLTILCTTITTIDEAIFYSFKVKIGDPDP